MAVSRPRKGSLQYTPLKRSKKKPTFKKTKNYWCISQLPLVKLGMFSYLYSKDSKNKQVSPCTLLELPLSLTLRRIFSKDLSSSISCKKLGEVEEETLCQVIFKFKGYKKRTQRVYLKKQLLEKRDRKTNEIDLSLFSYLIKDTKYVDVIGRTKGKGVQGIVKRKGTKIKKRKHFRTAKKRLIGSQGCFNPGVTSWRVPMAGQLGNANRISYNHEIISSKYLEDDSNIHILGKNKYVSLVDKNYLILKGSVPGPKKSLVNLRYKFRNGY